MAAQGEEGRLATDGTAADCVPRPSVSPSLLVVDHAIICSTDNQQPVRLGPRPVKAGAGAELRACSCLRHNMSAGQVNTDCAAPALLMKPT